MSFNIPKPVGGSRAPLKVSLEAGPPQIPVAAGSAPAPRRKPPPIDFNLVGKPGDDEEPVPKPHAYNMLYDHPPMPAPRQRASDTIESLADLGPDDWHHMAATGAIKEVAKVGEGNGGSVSKCQVGPHIFALKLINSDPNSDIERQILRELQYNRACSSPYIVQYYGTFSLPQHSQIGIAMEYMAGKSLDAVYKRVMEMDPTNRVNEKILGEIATSVLSGLLYLHSQRIIHRDIKPSNILFSADGQIKLCDFGVSGEVVNSLATTFVGTQYYMAPERILGKPYSVTSDVWSLGLTLLEVARGEFPFRDGSTDLATISPIALVNLILEYEPKLVDNPADGIHWSDSLKNFIGYCLRKNPDERPSPRQMLQHPWAVGQAKINVRMDLFIKRLWG
ncbi:MAP kinase kinase Mkk1p/SSP32 [Diutina catenulata]